MVCAVVAPRTRITNTLDGVAVDDLLLPPAHDVVTAWAGAGRVVCATESEVAAWRLPEPQKAALVSCGVPLIEDLVDTVSFRAEATTYRLASFEDPDLVYGAVPGTGEVRAWSSDGDACFVNSTIVHWLCSLHMVGSWLASSTVIGRWCEDGKAEEDTFAEIADLLQRIATLDPPAIGDGDHVTHFWPGVLDRWLY